MKMFIHLFLIGSLIASPSSGFSLENPLELDYPFSQISLAADQESELPVTSLENSEEEELEEDLSNSRDQDFTCLLGSIFKPHRDFETPFHYIEPEKRPPRG